MDGYFVHFVAPENLPPMPKHVIFVLDTSGRSVDDNPHHDDNFYDLDVYFYDHDDNFYDHNYHSDDNEDNDDDLDDGDS